MISWPGEIRLARDADGPAIGKLFAEAEYPDYGVNWTVPGVGGWWIVGELDGQIRGAILAITSKPYGYIGEIVIHPDERGKNPDGQGRLMAQPGILGILLYYTAFGMMHRAGCQLALGWVAVPSLLKILEKNGGIRFGEGFTMIGKRLA